MYKSKNHSKYSLKAHLVFVVKYRKKLLVDERIIEKLKFKLLEITTRSNFEIEVMEVDKDHIHLLIDYEPKISIVQIVRRLKQESTIFLWHRFEKLLKKEFWKENTFWNNGYFVCNIGVGTSYEVIKEYIKSQG